MTLEEMIPAELPDDARVRVNEVAEWLGVGVHCVYKWAKNGRLPQLYKLGPRTQFFLVGEIRESLRKLEEQPKKRRLAK